MGDVWSYRKIDELKAQDPILKEFWDDIAKANFVKENHLGGIISWIASQDKDTDGNGVRKELGKAIKTEFYGNSPIPNRTIQNKANINTNVQVELKSLVYTGAQGFAFTTKNQLLRLTLSVLPIPISQQLKKQLLS